jgi:ribosomal protein S18 acetylase RimI-like enzyme/predicted nucleotidyltransferase
MTIRLEPRHLELLQKLLKPYDCSFYVFGSRISTTGKRFSDIDLLYFEELSSSSLCLLEEALEASDLPYKVDLVNYQSCDEAFKKLIGSRYVCIQTSSRLRELEQTHQQHFEYLPKVLGYEVVESSEGGFTLACLLGSSLFNIVYGRPFRQSLLEPISEQSWETEIHKVMQIFKGQPFAWWVPPSQKHPDFTKALLKANFVQEANAEAMFCALSTFPDLEPKTGLTIKAVQDNPLLNDFTRLLSAYDPSATTFYKNTPIEGTFLKEKFFVGFENDTAVSIISAFEHEKSLAIFNLLTREDARRKGYAREMLAYILNAAKHKGYTCATLSASSQSGFSLYASLGFKSIGSFECFEYKSPTSKQCSSPAAIKL